MERLSGLDASFLYLETPTHHMHVAVALVFDPTTIPGGYSFERIKRSVADRLPAAPVLHRRLVEVPFRLGHPVWVHDPDVDIDAHVRLTAVPPPGGMAELASLAGEITSHQLDRSRPLWEIWLVEGMVGDRLGVVAKMHHSVVDGIAGAALLSVLFDLEAEPPPVPVAPPADDRRVPSSLELISRALMARTLRPFEMARDVVRTSRKLADIRRVRIGSDRTEGQGKAALPLSAPRTSFNSALTRRRSVAFTSIGLDDVRRVGTATGTTVNDVVLAVCAGALRSYLQKEDELPDKPLVAVVPVSVSSGDLQPIGSNLVSAMFVHLPTQMDDPLERLRAIREGTRGAKLEHDALGPELLQSWAQHATPNVFTVGARLYTGLHLADRHRPIANLVVSNFPGPEVPLYLGGARLTAGYPLGPVMDGMGVNITVMSYRGRLNWGFHTSPDIVPSVSSLADAMPRALDELADAVPSVLRSVGDLRAGTIAKGVGPGPAGVWGPKTERGRPTGVTGEEPSAADSPVSTGPAVRNSSPVPTEV
jgi:WS/DGAT/MGAT family acyltransferase